VTEQELRGSAARFAGRRPGEAGISASEQLPLPGGGGLSDSIGLGGVRAWATRRNIGGKLVIALMASAVLAGIVTFLVMSGTGGVQVSQQYASLLLIVDLVIGLTLGAVITWGIVRIWAARRAGSAGARLHVRLVGLFTLVAVVPAVIVAVLAALFFNFQVQGWFTERVRTAVENSVAVAEAYLNEHRHVIAADALAMANDLNRAWPEIFANPTQASQTVQTQAAIRALSEAIVFDNTGRVLARAGLSASLEFDRPPFWAIENANNGEVILLTNETSDRVRALVALDTVPRAYLYVGRFVDQNVLRYLERTRKAANEYAQSESRRSKLQITMIGIFVVVTLLLLLAAVGVGLGIANRLTRPIGRLALAAERVRAGDLSVRVDERDAEDELGLLSRAFNRMTRQLEEQRREVVEANRQIEDRRRFTEAVLAGVSAGVIGLDAAARINLPNRSAAALLGSRIENLVGAHIDDVVPGAAELVDRARARPHRVVEEHLSIPGSVGTRTLLVRIAAEAGYGNRIDGFVVTFDDITELLAAQRKAAWADVARRIAHEIKNPLTPIQLSAERLKRKYLPQIVHDPLTFEQCTETIVRRVGDIGRMVDEFSAFARMPDPVFAPTDLRAVCRDAFALQRHARGDIDFELDLPDRQATVDGDVGLIGQAVTNLLQNAVDAIEGRSPDGSALPRGHVRLMLLPGDPAAGTGATIVIEDNGKGLPEENRARLTEPYVTTRVKGTGLGLAIVKKIMEDHGGSLRLEDRRGTGNAVEGACILLVFPPRQVTDSDGPHPGPSD
jgi:two-component system nitrogen regulation sensor histidine kinase NtrY